MSPSNHSTAPKLYLFHRSIDSMPNARLGARIDVANDTASKSAMPPVEYSGLSGASPYHPLEPQKMTLLLRRSIRSGGLSPEDIKNAVTLGLLLLPLLGSSLSDRAFAVWFRTDIRFCL